MGCSIESIVWASTNRCSNVRFFFVRGERPDKRQDTTPGLERAVQKNQMEMADKPKKAYLFLRTKHTTVCPAFSTKTSTWSDRQTDHSVLKSDKVVRPIFDDYKRLFVDDGGDYKQLALAYFAARVLNLIKVDSKSKLVDQKEPALWLPCLLSRFVHNSR